MIQPTRSAAVLRSIAAAFVTFAPALTWLGVNASASKPARTIFDDAEGPAWYFGCVFFATALVAIVPLAIRRRNVAELAGMWMIVAFAALAMTAFAFGLATRSSVSMAFEPMPVQDITRFSRVYYSVYEVNSISSAQQPLMRRSWRYDEYGMGANATSRHRFVVLWEEYGLPFRCFISPLGLDFQHGAQVASRLVIVPIPFIANTLVLALIFFAIPWVPRHLRARYRRQEHRCVQCGYPLKQLVRCPECGTTYARFSPTP